MADGRAVALRVLIAYLLTLFVKKPTFITCEPVRYSWSYYDIDSVTFVENSYIYQSIWQYKLQCGIKLRQTYALQLILLLSGDIEICPGPECERQLPEAERLVKLRGCNIFHQNVRGLWSGLELIREFVQSFKPHILSLTETHTDDDTGGVYQIDGYEFINKPRK